jgi:hypothetical protein
MKNPLTIPAALLLMMLLIAICRTPTIIKAQTGTENELTLTQETSDPNLNAEAVSNAGGGVIVATTNIPLS